MTTFSAGFNIKHRGTMPNISVTASAYPPHKEITLISVKGFIDTTTAPEFEKVFQTALGEKKFNLIIDLKEVNYVSSAGWGIFVGEIKRIRSQKGNLFLVGMNPEVAEVFELLEFDSILKAFPTVEQAVQKGFGKTKPSRGTDKSFPEPVMDKPQADMASETPAMNISFDEPSASGDKKPHWVFRMLMPWTWF